LISHRFPLALAGEAYALVGGGGSALGILLDYPDAAEQSDGSVRARTIPVAVNGGNKPAAAGQPVIGFIGAGNYATQVLIPAFHKTPAVLRMVASAAGVSSVHAGKKFGVEKATTDTDGLIADPDINTIVITTRHNSHARYVCAALEQGKHVFVEKPLAITRDELAQIERTWKLIDEQGDPPLLMVGFNRRFAPHVQKIKRLVESVREPKSFVMTVNAGAIPADHWTQDRTVGGGRIIGEGCHFIDLLRYLAGAQVVSTQATMLGAAEGGAIRDDKVTITLSFADGSFGTVHYFANGHKGFPKERLEVFCAGRILQLDNFRQLKGYGWPGFKKMNLFRQDKGNAACAAAFVDAVQTGKPSPIPFDQLVEVTRTTFDVVEMLG
jgi:predicted dehydrogenase